MMEYTLDLPAEHVEAYLHQGKLLANALLTHNNRSLSASEDQSVVLNAVHNFWIWIETTSDLKQDVVPAKQLEIQPPWQKHVSSYRVRKAKQRNATLQTLKQKQKRIRSSQALERLREIHTPLNFKASLKLKGNWGDEWAEMAAAMFITSVRTALLMDRTLKNSRIERSGSGLCQQRHWSLQFLLPSFVETILVGNMPLNYKTRTPAKAPFYTNLFLRLFRTEPAWTTDPDAPIKVPCMLFMCRATKAFGQNQFTCAAYPMIMSDQDHLLLLDNLYQNRWRLTGIEMRLFLAFSGEVPFHMFLPVLNPRAPIPANYRVKRDPVRAVLSAVETDGNVYDEREFMGYDTDSDDEGGASEDEFFYASDGGGDDDHVVSASAVAVVPAADARVATTTLASVAESVGSVLEWAAPPRSASTASSCSSDYNLPEAVDATEQVFRHGLQCLICLRSFKDGHLVRHLECKHTFHACCLSGHLAHTGDRRCPLCTKPIRFVMGCEL